MITLVGLITKHGILIVEFSNPLQQQGIDKIDAVIEASVLSRSRSQAVLVLKAVRLSAG